MRQHRRVSTTEIETLAFTILGIVYSTNLIDTDGIALSVSILNGKVHF